LLHIKTADNWPIFSTLEPKLDRKKGSAEYEVGNFSLLADAQILLGKDLKLYKVPEAPIPLFIAVYAEEKASLQGLGEKSLKALRGLADYFGFIPMPHYTVIYEFLEPISDRHNYGFNMEHLNSMTASNDTSRARLTTDPEAGYGTIVHHMGHSWIPLRSYGRGYRPFQWQTAPLIETIWLNEGFIWYIAYYYVMDRTRILNLFNNVVENAPTFIWEKSLRELSLLGSTQYSLDFRIGKNLFSRGALLARELDVFIQQESKGTKSFKDAVLGLMKWTEEKNRAFDYDEIEPIMSTATGIDLKNIWQKWQNE
jgi:predicted metalloprotease with PDZ domain